MSLNCRCPGCHRGQGCWYKRAEWRRTAKAVLIRDHEVCRIVDGCQRMATVADHITPVGPATSWHEFIAMSGLRAGCHTHNTARGQMLNTTLSSPLRSVRRTVFGRPVFQGGAVGMTAAPAISLPRSGYGSTGRNRLDRGVAGIRPKPADPWR